MSSPVRRLALTLVVATAMAAVPTAPASAYFDGPAYAFPTPDYGPGLLGAAAMNATAQGAGGSSSSKRRKGPRKPAKAPKPKRPTAAQLRKLRFVPSRAVTERIEQRLVEQTGQDPAALIPEFNRTKGDWNRVLTRTVGWSANDLGDAAAFTLLQLHVLHSGKTMLDDRGAEKVRRAMRDQLALRRDVRRLSADRKQELVEVLQLNTIVHGSTAQQGRARGDAGAVTEAQGHLRRFAREVFSVDLDRIRLTKNGFVRR